MIENYFRCLLSLAHQWRTSPDKGGRYNPAHAQYGLRNADLVVRPPGSPQNSTSHVAKQQ